MTPAAKEFIRIGGPLLALWRHELRVREAAARANRQMDPLVECLDGKIGTLPLSEVARLVRSYPSHVRRCIGTCRMRGLRFVWPGEPWRGVRKGKLKTTRAVVSDRGERWECRRDAAEALGVGPTAISNAIRGGSRCRGRYLWFKGDKPFTPLADRERPVERVEDGQRFESLRAAMIACGREPNGAERMAISRAIQRNRGYAGFHFRDAKARRPTGAEQAA